MATKGFTRLQLAEIPVGTPLAWSIFDEDGNVAYRPGYVFRNRQELATAERMTLLYKSDAGPAKAEMPPPAASKRAPINENPAADSETSLDEIRLHIGEAWQLQPLSDLDPKRYYVKLVGYLKPVSVIITAPTVDDKALLIREGQAFVVRAFSGKSAYAFKTTVIKSVGAPFPHLHLAYPPSVRGMIVRRSERIDVNIITSITPTREGLAKAPGIICNASKTGASLRTPAPIGQSGDRIGLSFKLLIEGNDYLLTLEGIIRAVRAPNADQGKVVEYGIQFIDIKPIDQLVIGAFVNSLIANVDTA
jgi:c-di-GMP-binding flagellar brake protein YcgR